jgi:uncharacterized protein (DUF924 family)
MKGPSDVLDFWFVEHGEDDWFGGKAEFDAKLAERFTETHARVAIGEAFTWRTGADGRLAEIIVLDQFSRQLYRGSSRAFEQDPMALTLSQEAVTQGLDTALEPRRRMFLYMPYMHSESLLVHQEAVRLFTALGNEDTLQYELNHCETIDRFGRYPFRNKPLGRESTAEELAYMEEMGTRGF